MRTVRKTISIPKELAKYAEEAEKQLALKEGRLPNDSQFIARLIARDKAEAGESTRKKAA